MVSICVSSMTQDVEHLFMGLFAICVSYLVKYLFHLWPIELDCFLAVEFFVLFCFAVEFHKPLIYSGYKSFVQ